MKDKILAIKQHIEQTTGSSTFCPLPWIHMATRPNGDARLCCTANASGAEEKEANAGMIVDNAENLYNYGQTSIKEIMNSDCMSKIRLDMLSEKIPKSCKKCFKEEAAGVVSKRLWESNYWKNRNLDFSQLKRKTDKNGRIPFELKYLDLRLGNTCNLACVMCTPHDSSKWVNETKKIIKILREEDTKKQIQFDPSGINFFWYEKPEFWNEIYSQIENIESIYFAGGEPLAIKEHNVFLKKMIDEGYSKKINLRYNSNGVLVNDEVIDLWKQFKYVQFAVSVDNLKEKNSYIRYPSKWREIEEALEKLDNTPENIDVSIESTVQALNILDLPDLAKWKIQKNYKKINKYYIDGFLTGGGLINFHLLYLPDFLDARVLDQEVKTQIIKKFQDFKVWLYENYTTDDNFWKLNPYGWKRWEAIMDFVTKDDRSFLKVNLIDYLDALEKTRGVDWKPLFPYIN